MFGSWGRFSSLSIFPFWCAVFMKKAQIEMILWFLRKVLHLLFDLFSTLVWTCSNSWCLHCIRLCYVKAISNSCCFFLSIGLIHLFVSTSPGSSKPPNVFWLAGVWHRTVMSRGQGLAERLALSKLKSHFRSDKRPTKAGFLDKVSPAPSQKRKRSCSALFETFFQEKSGPAALV